MVSTYIWRDYLHLFEGRLLSCHSLEVLKQSRNTSHCTQYPFKYSNRVLVKRSFRGLPLNRPDRFILLINYIILLFLLLFSDKAQAWRPLWTVSPCSFIDIDRRFKGAYCLLHQSDNHRRDYGAVSTSETSVIFCETTRHNQEDSSILAAMRTWNLFCPHFVYSYPICAWYSCYMLILRQSIFRQS
jgi:hypothetical protein